MGGQTYTKCCMLNIYIQLKVAHTIVAYKYERKTNVKRLSTQKLRIRSVMFDDIQRVFDLLLLSLPHRFNCRSIVFVLPLLFLLLLLSSVSRPLIQFRFSFQYLLAAAAAAAAATDVILLPLRFMTFSITKVRGDRERNRATEIER